MTELENNQEQILKLAIAKWGEELQTNLAQEECAELIAAIAHYRRGRTNSLDAMIEEIADVKIMITQMEIMFGKDKVDEVVIRKIERLSKRLGLGVYES
jgi:NTP pyrophosphatase (non-canonical NTP hydrolase)